MNKWKMPSFLVTIVTMIAVALNDRFMWHLSPTQLIASITVAVNFVGVSIWKDIVILKSGGKPTLNSTKLVTALLALGIIGFSSYVGIDLDNESVWWVAGMAGAFMTGKGVQDYIDAKKDAVVEPEPAPQASVLMPAPKTYQEIVPIATEVHTKINQLYANVKSGKMTDATMEAVQMYMRIQDLLQQYQAPEEKKGA